MERPEGSYPEWITYPPEPLAGATRMLKIERVAGDGTVNAVTITRAEAWDLFDFLADEFV
jgi:hypothetical protein